MSWTTPKTDWTAGYDGTEYTGDFFNSVDYNRIKNNLIVLHELAERLYETISITSLGDDKVVGDYLYADEINNIENALEVINKNTFNLRIGDKKMYYPNGYTPDYYELNRIESQCARLYELFQNQWNGRRMFTWNFGIKGGF